MVDIAIPLPEDITLVSFGRKSGDVDSPDSPPPPLPPRCGIAVDVCAPSETPYADVQKPARQCEVTGVKNGCSPESDDSQAPAQMQGKFPLTSQQFRRLALMGVIAAAVAITLIAAAIAVGHQEESQSSRVHNSDSATDEFEVHTTVVVLTTQRSTAAVVSLSMTTDSNTASRSPDKDTRTLNVPVSTAQDTKTFNVPVSTVPDTVLVSTVPDTVLVSTVPDTVPLSTAPDTVPVSTVPDTVPVSTVQDTVPLSTAPDTVPVSTVPDTVPVSTVPDVDTVPLSTAPDTVPVSTVPDTVPLSTAPDTVPVSTVPDTVPVSTIPDTVPLSTVPDTVPVSTVPDTVPVSAAQDTKTFNVPVSTAQDTAAGPVSTAQDTAAGSVTTVQETKAFNAPVSFTSAHVTSATSMPTTVVSKSIDATSLASKAIASGTRLTSETTTQENKLGLNTLKASATQTMTSPVVYVPRPPPRAGKFHSVQAYASRVLQFMTFFFRLSLCPSHCSENFGGVACLTKVRIL